MPTGREKDKKMNRGMLKDKSQTSLLCYVQVMSSCYVACKRTQEPLEAFFLKDDLRQYLMVSKKKNPLFM